MIALDIIRDLIIPNKYSQYTRFEVFYKEVFLPARKLEGADAKEDFRIFYQWIQSSFGCYQLKQIKSWHLRCFLDELETYDIAPRTRRNIYAKVRLSLRYAQEAGLLDHVPNISLRGLDTDKDPAWREHAGFSDVERSLLVRDERIPLVWRLTWALCGLAGLRISEVAALRVSSIDLKLQPLSAIKVTQAYRSRSREFKSTKTGQPRLVPIHPFLEPLILQRIEWIHAQRGMKEDRLLIETEDSSGNFRPLRNSSAIHRLRDDLERIGLRRRGTHSFRASFVTSALEGGFDARLVEHITHNRPTGTRHALSGYVRPNYSALCEMVSKIRVPRVLTTQLAFNFTK